MWDLMFVLTSASVMFVFDLMYCIRFKLFVLIAVSIVTSLCVTVLVLFCGSVLVSGVINPPAFFVSFYSPFSSSPCGHSPLFSVVFIGHMSEKSQGGSGKILRSIFECVNIHVAVGIGAGW